MNTQSLSTRRFAGVVLITYLLPTVMFALLLTVFRDVSGTVKYLLTIFSSLMFMVLGLWAMHKEGISLEAVGITARKGLQALGLELAALLLFTGLLIGLAAANGQLKNLTGPSVFHIDAAGLRRIFLQWLFVGMGEEILFRGFLLTWLRQRFSAFSRVKALALALLLANLIFASMHLPQRIYTISQGELKLEEMALNLLIVFLIGVWLSYVFLRTNNILLAGLAHGMINAPLVGMTGDLLLPLMLVVCIEASLYLRSRRLNKMLEHAPQAETN